MLAESLDEEMDLDLDSEDDEFMKIIQATTNDVIESDKKELREILRELKEEVTEDYIDAGFMKFGWKTYSPDDRGI